MSGAGILKQRRLGTGHYICTKATETRHLVRRRVVYERGLAAAAERFTTVTSNVQEQMLALPRTDDLRKCFVLGFLDRRIGQHEAIAEQVHQGLGLTQQA
jgi:hypothetical protein